MFQFVVFVAVGAENGRMAAVATEFGWPAETRTQDE